MGKVRVALQALKAVHRVRAALKVVQVLVHPQNLPLRAAQALVRPQNQVRAVQVRAVVCLLQVRAVALYLLNHLHQALNHLQAVALHRNLQAVALPHLRVLQVVR